ncbi:MAG: hypothetical protein ACYDBQ_02530 [Thermoplasmatota archaeon]
MPSSSSGREASQEKTDRLATLKELAKLTKPTGPSAQGKGEENPEADET